MRRSIADFAWETFSRSDVIINSARVMQRQTPVIDAPEYEYRPGLFDLKSHRPSGR